MASHGAARSTRTRTDEQRQKDAARIDTYHQLESEIRQKTRDADAYADADLLQLTTRLLRLNPEYYTIWNDRRRCLISGSLSKPLAGSWPSRASPSLSRNGTTTPSSAESSSSSSAAIPRPRDPQTTGPNGTTADASQPQQHSVAPENGQSANEVSLEQWRRQQDMAAAAASQDKEVLVSELAFTVPLLMESPKCYWIWNYRRWILAQTIQRLPTAAARRIWEAELALVSKMLSRDRRNFHAWGYRRYVVEKLEDPVLRGSSMAEAEFAYTTRMIANDLSNFSAWHARAQLSPRLLRERGASDDDRAAFLDAELQHISEAVNVGPDDQSLWYYHGLVMSHVANAAVHGDDSIAPALTSNQRATRVKTEIENIKDLLSDYPDTKWIYEALLEYTIALARLEDPADRAATEQELRAWLDKVKALDPLRSGRWGDDEEKLRLP